MMRAHQYGPNDPATAPTHVDLKDGTGVRTIPPADLLVRPADFPRLAPGAVRQRAALNGLAYERSRHARTRMPS